MAVEHLVDDRWRFWASVEAALRTILVIARVRCLQIVQRGRHDAEEIVDVDVDLSSHKQSVKWAASLEESDRTLITIYRNGA
eukprot:7378078-Pyramimonas_sp.AAC.1